MATLCTLLAWHAELLSAQSSDADHRPQQCVSGPVAWMQRALDTWALVSRNSLELRPDSLPWIILYDARCAWHLSPRGAPAESSHDMTGRVALRFAGAPVTVYAFEHGDTLHLPVRTGAACHTASCIHVALPGRQRELLRDGAPGAVEQE